eukprot:2345912-Rhodomonas_salina.1
MNHRIASRILVCFFLTSPPFPSPTVNCGDSAAFRRAPPVRPLKGSVGWFPKLTEQHCADTTHLRGGFFRGEREASQTVA